MSALDASRYEEIRPLKALNPKSIQNEILKSLLENEEVRTGHEEPLGIGLWPSLWGEGQMKGSHPPTL